MNEKTPSKDRLSQPSEAQTREARLKAALKANMGRRKQQARARSVEKPEQKGQ